MNIQDALLAFKEKLSEQLALIEEAQMKKAGKDFNKNVHFYLFPVNV